MFEPRVPKYQWGRPVRAAVDLLNDGSYPEQPGEGLLVAAGEEGEIVNVGLHTESNTPVYIVEFTGNRVVGVVEEEIAPLGAATAVDGGRIQEA
jgi:nitrogen fixation protein NifZ